MNTFEAILTRRSIRKYIDKSIDEIIGDIDFFDDLLNIQSFKIGMCFQRFCDGLSIYDNGDKLHVFDGKDVLLNYEMRTEPSLFSSSNEGYIEYYNLNDNNILKIEEFVKRKNTFIDNVNEIFLESEYHIEIGKYEIAYLNLAILLEMISKKLLSAELESSGYFKERHKNRLKEKKLEKYGKSRSLSFYDKYFEYGLIELLDFPFEDFDLQIVDQIYSIRNKIAHGLRLIDVLEKENIEYSNLESYMRYYLLQISKLMKLLDSFVTNNPIL